MRQLLSILCLLLTSFFATLAAAQDVDTVNKVFVFPDGVTAIVGEEILLPVEVSAVPQWKLLPTERYAWNYCVDFVREMHISHYMTTADCVDVTQKANGFTSWEDFRHLPSNSYILVPSMVNDSQMILLRLQQRGTLAAQSGLNPIGDADKIREAAIIQITVRLDALETEQKRLAGELTTTRSETAAVAASLGGKVDQSTHDTDIGALNARIDDIPSVVKAEDVVGLESTVNDLIGRKLLLIQVETMWKNPWWWVVVTISVVALFLGFVALFKKPSKDIVKKSELKAIDEKITEISNELVVIKATAGSAQEVAAEAKTKSSALTNRVRDVEELQILQLTLDAQDRFNCPDLSDDSLKILGKDEYLTFEIVCLDNRTRKVHVSKGTGGDGEPRLHFFGLEKGHDFIDTISLPALYRHIAKARQADWIIGITAAAKAA